MKRCVLIIVLAVMTISTAAFSQMDKRQPEKGMELEIRRRHAQLEMKEHESKSQFRREMQKLELEKKKIELGRKRQAFKYKADKHRKKGGALFLFVCFIIHILLTVWVYQDIRKRNSGSGIWIAVTLLSGFFGALLYAIVRLGDMRQQKS